MTIQYPTYWYQAILSDAILEYADGEWGVEWKKFLDKSFWLSVRVIRATDLADWAKVKGKYATERGIDIFTFQEKKLKIGDILMETSGGSPEKRVGRVIFIDEECLNNSEKPLLYSNFFRLIRTQQQTVNSKYLYYFFKFAYEFRLLDDYQKLSNNLRNMSFVKFVNEATVPLPPLSEQNAIVEKLDLIFTDLEAARKKLAKIPKYLAKFRQAVLQRAVSGELTEEWREKNKIKLSEKINLAQISDALSFQDGFSSGKWNEKGKGYMHIRPFNIKDDKFNFDTVKSVDIDNNNLPFIKEGDIIFNNTNSLELVGKSALWNFKDKSATLSNHMTIIRVKDSTIIKNNYFIILLQSLFQSGYFKSVAKTYVNQANVSNDILLAINVIIPSITEQTEIVRQVELLFAIADKVQANYETAMDNFNKLEKSILQQAFSGELVAAAPQTESLESLLEKIREEKEKLEKEKKEWHKKQAKFKKRNFMKASEHAKIKAKIKEEALAYATPELTQENINEIREKVSDGIQKFDYDDFEVLFRQLAQNKIKIEEEEPFFQAVNIKGKLHYKINKPNETTLS
jgi:type I restriction enzyme S subunit